MQLQTDEQTIGDLMIFSREGNGIFDLYNQTRTRGGESVLKELFRHPLSDKEEINRRSTLIGFFARQKVDFPYDVSTFDLVERYMNHAEGHFKNMSQQAVLGEKEINNSVTAVIEFLQVTKKFIHSDQLKNIEAFNEQKGDIDQLLTDTALAPVFTENLKNKLSFTAVTAYDALFRLREHGKIKKLLTHIYYLDVYLSVAKLAAERNFIFPNAREKGQAFLNLKGAYHPELKNPVDNDLEMEQGKNVLFLTGANMAGKSTFLRSISITVYLAHMGFPVAAASMEFSVMDGIYTTINLPDNLGIGASHFYNEVLRVKKIAKDLSENKSLFVVFDEMFRGTNVKDANEATVVVTRGFAEKRNSLFIISSHIVEAGEALRHQPAIDFKYLPTLMNGHIPEYTYKLEKGITSDRHGMIIIRNERILEILRDGKKE